MSKQYKMDKKSNRIVEVKPGDAVVPETVERTEVIDVETVPTAPVEPEDKPVKGEALNGRCMQDAKVAGIYHTSKTVPVAVKDKTDWRYYIGATLVAHWSIPEGRWLVTPGTISV